MAQAPSRVRSLVTSETTGGVLLFIAALMGLVFANAPWRDAYEALSTFEIGPAALHLNLTLAAWASDGLLAIFFFVVGVELKQEFVNGSLRNPRLAAVPVLAAIGGMVVPAAAYVAVVIGLGDGAALNGWAIPTATDIAFAVAVLAVFGRGLPRALRTFLLTLAVVDDLLAIIVIAIFYTAGVDFLLLLASLAFVAVFAALVRTKQPRWWLLLPVAATAWTLMHASGVHATIAGVLLGLSVPAALRHGESEPRTEQYGHRIGPYSSGLALPIFAFFSAGVNLIDGAGASEALVQPVVLAIVAGLVVGKVLGVLGTTALVVRFSRLRLPDAIGLRDLLPIGFLTGIGFTVALLIAELSFADGEYTAGAKIAVLGATAIATILAAGFLRWDARAVRNTDMNEDGIIDADIDRIGDPRP